MPRKKSTFPVPTCLIPEARTKEPRGYLIPTLGLKRFGQALALLGTGFWIASHFGRAHKLESPPLLSRGTENPYPVLDEPPDVPPLPPLLQPSKKLGIVLSILVIGFFISLVFHYEAGAVGGQRYPFNTFLFRPYVQLNDFYSSFLISRTSFILPEDRRDINIGWGSTVLMFYSWALYAALYPVRSMPDLHAMRDPSLQGPFLAWLLIHCVFTFGLLYLVQRTIRRVSPDCTWAKSLILALCSYPVLFCLDRGNFECVIFLALAGSIFLYGRGKTVWSALLLGLVVSAKPYAVVFVVLYASDRRFKEIAVSLGTALLLTVGALVALPGSILNNLGMLQISMELYTKFYVLENEGMYFGSSLYGMLKVLIYSSDWIKRGDAFPQTFMKVYFYFSVFFFALISLLICVLRMEFWKKIALLVCCMNLLPYVCGDYRLIHLFIPLLLFLRERELAWGDKLTAVLFALLLIPKGFYHFVFNHSVIVNAFEVTDSIVANPLLMLALIAVISRSVLRKPQISDTARWFIATFPLRRPQLAA